MKYSLIIEKAAYKEILIILSSGDQSSIKN